MTSTPIGGFDLVLGKLYNDFWFNAAPPNHWSNEQCSKCSTKVTVHRLEKLVFAFGKMMTKYCIVHTCPQCLHEVLVTQPTTIGKPKPATKANLVKLFSKLPKQVQQQILMEGVK